MSAMLLALAGPLQALDPARAPSQYAINQWGRRAGLPSDSVHAILPARDRYLWLGTSAGLVRFDGSHFLVFDNRSTPGFGDGGVSALGEAADGTLYVGTTLGATLRYANGGFSPVEFPLRASELTGIRSIIPAGDGTLWIAALTWPLLRRNEGPVRVVPPGQLDTIGPSTLLEDPARGVWVGTQRQGLYLHRDGHFTRHAVTDDTVQALAADGAGGLWIGTPHGLGRYSSGHVAWFTARDGLSHSNVTALLLDRDRNLWIGTMGGGLTRLRDGRFDRFTSREGLSDDDVHCLAEDHEGNVWVGTAKGLDRLTDPSFVTYGRLEGLTDAGVQSVAEGRGGSVWVGTSAASVARIRGGRIDRFALPHGPGRDGVIGLHEARNGSLWASQDTGRLFRIDGDTLSEQTPLGAQPTWKVSAFSEDEQGMLFFITGVGLARVEKRRVVPVPLPEGVPELRYVTVIHRDRRGTLWLGGSRGLLRVDGTGHKMFTVSERPFASRVRGLSEDKDGSLWLATASGLAHLHGETQRVLSTGQGLPENYLRLVLDDGHGRLWIASRTQIFRLEKKDVLEVLAGRRRQVTPLVFDSSDGLPTTEGMLGSTQGFRGRDGRLWFTTAKGVSAVDPARLATDAPAPPVFIEKLTVDGESARRDSYGPGRGEVTIEYSALVYRSPDKIRFRYRLEGLDHDWVEAGPRRSAYYSNLRPRRYSFSVAASNPSGLEIGAPATISFQIRPPFHQTPLFYAAGALSLVLLAAAAHRLRVGHMKERFGAVLAERTRIARELHDSLAQSLAGTKLQIDVAMGALPPEPASAVVRKHLHLARSMVGAGMAEVRRSIWVLRAQASRRGESLADSLAQSLARLASESSCRLTLDVAGEPRPMTPEVERNLLRIVHEAVTNALRHSGAENISATLRFAPEDVHLRVCDDGRGFDPEAMRAKAEHFGLLGMAERAHTLGGFLRVESAADAGTEIDCRLPYRPKKLVAEVSDDEEAQG